MRVALGLTGRGAPGRPGACWSTHHFSVFGRQLKDASQLGIHQVVGFRVFPLSRMEGGGDYSSILNCWQHDSHLTDTHTPAHTAPPINMHVNLIFGTTIKKLLDDWLNGAMLKKSFSSIDPFRNHFGQTSLENHYIIAGDSQMLMLIH